MRGVGACYLKGLWTVGEQRSAFTGQGRYSQPELWSLAALIVIAGRLVISSGFTFVAWFVLPPVVLFLLESLCRPLNFPA